MRFTAVASFHRPGFHRRSFVAETSRDPLKASQNVSRKRATCREMLHLQTEEEMAHMKWNEGAVNIVLDYLGTHNYAAAKGKFAPPVFFGVVFLPLLS